ncbi:MAG: hypothetical protein K1W19_08575 [Lachnospiraceae bacterium]
MGENIKNGKMEVMGINVDISQILGEKIIDQYMAQLTEEDVKVIMDYISQDFFIKKEEKIFNYDTSKYDTKMAVYIKERETDHWGNKKGSITIGELIKQKFEERIKAELCEKVEEIVKSTDYQEKIEEIAAELVDYSINGYKEDMKERIRERLIGNVMDESPKYSGTPLLYLINQEIDKRFRG